MASEIVPSSKRPASPPANGALVVKRQRTDGELGTAEQVGPCSCYSQHGACEVSFCIPPSKGNVAALKWWADGHYFRGLQPIKRTSSLRAPIMLLTGHFSEVFTLKFSPSGNLLACEHLHG
jgi:hypothetical protein